MLQGKKIILGISGSIAAYKSAFLTRLLIKAGADVQIILTQAAAEFVTPLTLATLSKRPVLQQYVRDSTGVWNNHVELGLWADAMIMAPASANTLAKSANGLCDNLLAATYLSARCPVFFAPAMDLDMYAHPATRRNLETLRNFGNYIIEAEYGELASGLSGQGRMAEPENIIAYLEAYFAKKEGKPLAGKNVLVTAGPTYEPIDPVRFIGNHSSGKMGFALADAFAAQGANVTVVAGPTTCKASQLSVKVKPVTTASQMYEAAKETFISSDIVIFAAAVADYTPSEVASQKIKKTENDMFVNLKKTTDIASELGKLKQANQITVGFALETENEQTNAQSKLERKNLDFIVLNSLNDEGAGFQHDTNKITVLHRSGEVQAFPLKSKEAVAADIVGLVLQSMGL